MSTLDLDNRDLMLSLFLDGELEPAQLQAVDVAVQVHCEP